MEDVRPMSVKVLPCGPALRLTLQNEAGRTRKVVVPGDGAGIKVYEVVRLDGMSWLVVKIENTEILWTGGPNEKR